MEEGEGEGDEEGEGEEEEEEAEGDGEGGGITGEGGISSIFTCIFSISFSFLFCTIFLISSSIITPDNVTAVNRPNACDAPKPASVLPGPGLAEGRLQ